MSVRPLLLAVMLDCLDMYVRPGCVVGLSRYVCKTSFVGCVVGLSRYVCKTWLYCWIV
jgi:hypothetical protein